MPPLSAASTALSTAAQAHSTENMSFFGTLAFGHRTADKKVGLSLATETHW